MGTVKLLLKDSVMKIHLRITLKLLTILVISTGLFTASQAMERPSFHTKGTPIGQCHRLSAAKRSYDFWASTSKCEPHRHYRSTSSSSPQDESVRRRTRFHHLETARTKSQKEEVRIKNRSALD